MVGLPKQAIEGAVIRDILHDNGEAVDVLIKADMHGCGTAG